MHRQLGELALDNLAAISQNGLGSVAVMTFKYQWLNMKSYMQHRLSEALSMLSDTRTHADRIASTCNITEPW